MRRRAAIAILLVLPLFAAVAGNYYRELLALPRQQAAAAPAANNFLWLLHFDEAAGNTNFTDSGMSNITLITRGAAISNTVGGKFGNCVSFPQGTGYRRIELVDLEKRLANVGTNDWTVDFWVYLTAGSANGVQMLFGPQPGSAQRPFVYIYKGASNSMRVASAAVSSAYASDATANPSWNNYADAWTHIAVCRYTNVVMLYMNGVRQNQYNATLSGNPSYSWATCTNQTIGAPADENMPGMNYYDEIALRRRAVWQGTNFTPPTAAYTGSE